MSALRFFKEEYEAHIHDKFCPAGVCKGAIDLPSSWQRSAQGCGLCERSCPEDAITGDRKQPHVD